MNNTLTVLYVEDNQTVKENFEIIFSHYFKNVITADNGRDALKLYEENDIDIAILDISIPEIDGLSVAKTIRQKDKEIEIIMITGHSEKEKLLRAINLHLFAYLLKPVKRENLDDILNRVIKKLSQNSTRDLGNGYEFDTREKILFFHDQQVKISKHEKKLLHYLCEEHKQHHLACEISSYLFGQEKEDDSVCNNVIQLISRFKKKMLKSYHKEYFFIDNIYGLGYKIQK